MRYQGNIPDKIFVNLLDSETWDSYSYLFLEWILISYGKIDPSSTIQAKESIENMMHLILELIYKNHNIDKDTLLAGLVGDFFAKNICKVKLDQWIQTCHGNNVNKLYSEIVKELRIIDSEGIMPYMFNNVNSGMGEEDDNNSDADSNSDYSSDS